MKLINLTGEDPNRVYTVELDDVEAHILGLFLSAGIVLFLAPDDFYAHTGTTREDLVSRVTTTFVLEGMSDRAITLMNDLRDIAFPHKEA